MLTACWLLAGGQQFISSVVQGYSKCYHCPLKDTPCMFGLVFILLEESSQICGMLPRSLSCQSWDGPQGSSNPSLLLLQKWKLSSHVYWGVLNETVCNWQRSGKISVYFIQTHICVCVCGGVCLHMYTHVHALTYPYITSVYD